MLFSPQREELSRYSNITGIIGTGGITREAWVKTFVKLTCTINILGKHLHLHIFGLRLNITVCLKGPVKKYLPIARARNQPIT